MNYKPMKALICAVSVFLLLICAVPPVKVMAAQTPDSGQFNIDLICGLEGYSKYDSDVPVRFQVTNNGMILRVRSVWPSHLKIYPASVLVIPIPWRCPLEIRRPFSLLCQIWAHPWSLIFLLQMKTGKSVSARTCAIK